MLRLTLELLPRGDDRTVIPLGTVEIVNDDTGTEEIGNYHVSQRGTVHADATVTGVRRSAGHWPVALAALLTLLGTPKEST